MEVWKSRRQRSICKYFIKYEEIYVDLISKYVPKFEDVNICENSKMKEESEGSFQLCVKLL